MPTRAQSANVLTIPDAVLARDNSDRSAHRSTTAQSDAVVARLAALLFNQVDALDAHTALHRLDHVVDGEAGDRHSRKRLHLNSGRTRYLHAGADETARQ